MQATFLTIGTTPKRNAPTGAGTRAFQNLSYLRRIGFDVHIIAAEHQRQDWEDDGNVVFLKGYRWQSFAQLYSNLAYRRALQREVSRHCEAGAGLCFVEHWPALAVSPRQRRLLYSAHDLESKLTPVRWAVNAKQSDWKRRACRMALALAERRLLRTAAGVLSVSATEAVEIQRWTGRPAWYIPIVGDGLEAARSAAPRAAPRIWLYGGSGATANKFIVGHLQDELWHHLRAALPDAEFHQIGSIAKYGEARRNWLQAHFVVHGFVEEPARMFAPGDVCLIPYPHDTGYRTKLPELLALGVIPAGYEITFACSPELEPGRNCIAESSPQALASALAAVCRDPEQRARFAGEGLECFRRHFSQRVLAGRYQRLIEEFLERHDAGRSNRARASCSARETQRASVFQ